MKYIIPILLVILIISLFFENVFVEPLNNCQLADFPEVYGGDINYVSKSDQKTIIIRDFDREDYYKEDEDYYKEDEEYIKLARSEKKYTNGPVSRTTTEIPIELSTSNVPMTTKTPSNYSTPTSTRTTSSGPYTSRTSTSSTSTSSTSTSSTPTSTRTTSTTPTSSRPTQ